MCVWGGIGDVGLSGRGTDEPLRCLFISVRPLPTRRVLTEACGVTCTVAVPQPGPGSPVDRPTARVWTGPGTPAQGRCPLAHASERRAVGGCCCPLGGPPEAPCVPTCPHCVTAEWPLPTVSRRFRGLPAVIGGWRVVQMAVRTRNGFSGARAWGATGSEATVGQFRVISRVVYWLLFPRSV